MTLSGSATEELWEAFRVGGGAELVRDAVRLVLQELIEAEAAEAIGAARYERSPDRVTERNGRRSRLPAPGPAMQAEDPQAGEGGFMPSMLEPRRRIDRALHAVVTEALRQRLIHPLGG